MILADLMSVNNWIFGDSFTAIWRHRVLYASREETINTKEEHQTRFPLQHCEYVLLHACSVTPALYLSVRGFLGFFEEVKL